MINKLTNINRRFGTFNLPGILSDIDGVVYRGSEAIPGSANVIKSILKPFKHPINFPLYPDSSKALRLPFTLLTNGGGEPEQRRADYINDKLFKNDEEMEDKNLITKEDIILCHSPFSQPSLVNQYKDSFVLVSGLGDIIEVADTLYGYNKAIDIEELLALFP